MLILRPGPRPGLLTDGLINHAFDTSITRPKIISKQEYICSSLWYRRKACLGLSYLLQLCHNTKKFKHKNEAIEVANDIGAASEYTKHNTAVL